MDVHKKDSQLCSARSSGPGHTPPLLVAFDLLHQDGRELAGRPLRERRARLEDVVAGGDLVLPVRASRRTASRRGQR